MLFAKKQSYLHLNILLNKRNRSFRQLTCNDTLNMNCYHVAALLEVLACYPKMMFKDEDNKEKLDMMNKYFLMFRDIPTHRTKEDIVNERKWRRWADDSLVHMLSPNVYRTPSEALQAFQWFSQVGNWEEHFALWERLLVVYVGAAAMWIIGKRLKKRYKLKDDVR
jgi:microsomal prostaglandin-E synthase 2